MVSKSMLQMHLEQTEQDIQQSEEQLRKQRDLICMLKEMGLDSVSAERRLLHMEKVLALRVAACQRVREAIGKIERWEPDSPQSAAA